MSSARLDDNKDTVRIDNGSDTVRLSDNQDTVRIGNNNDTVRLNNNQDTVRIDNNNDTVRLGAGGIAPGGAVLFPGMGSAVGTMPQQNANTTGEVTPGHVIEINGVNYVIEDNGIKSGEAVIYKVNRDGNPFVLKYYNPENSFPKEVLSIIKANPSNRIIRLYDFGSRNNQDYEIMEYAEGGTLNQYLKENGPIKDRAKFKNIVRQISEGLEQLHGLRIIYQDLKPENIYFKDMNKTSIVLADFGISNVMKPGEEIVEVTAHVTKEYAAPELARYGDSKMAMAGLSVDYFALGIIMLQLWLGKRPFKDNNISDSQRAYLIAEEAVEFPSDMDANDKKLIQGLIRQKASKRWGNDEIKDWLDGKPLANNDYNESSNKKPSISYEQQMFNESESYATPAELAALLYKYPDRGKIGLYSSNFIETWLENAGNKLLAADIKNIKSEYAADKEAGLYFAIYTLDPTRAFISHGGKTCSDTAEIADAIMAESAYYMEELKKPNARFYLYLEATKGSMGKEEAEQLCKYFEEYSPKRALNLMYLIYKTDDSQMDDDRMDDDRSITIGSKTYQTPKEVASETDSKQIAFIKDAVQEEDSLFLVWLSYHCRDFTTTGGFGKLNTSDRFFLLNMFPFLSFKELVQNWKQVAISELITLIHSSPWRFDLFETYAAQGLPFSGQAQQPDWQPTPMTYLAMFFKDIIRDENAGLELVRFLHEKGADINESSGNGSFPLIIAVWCRNIPLVKLLLELGADINKTDGNSTPLLYALGKNDDNDEEAARIAIARLLLDFKADAKKIDTHDRYALPMAIGFESDEKVDLISHLLKAGADVNSKDKDGYSPLAIAVSVWNMINNKQSALNVIELLLKKGAKTQTLKKNGYSSPLMIAADINAVDAAQLLLKYGAQKDFTDMNGETAFIYAAKNNHTQMMALVDPGSAFTLKGRLFLFLKIVVSVLALGSVFLTMDVLARAILTFHLSFPVLLGISPLLSHLLTAYILIVLFGPREYLIKLRATFSFIGSGLRYLLGVPIVFPLLVLPLQFLTRFLPANITSVVSSPADFLTSPSTGFAMLAGYIALLAAIMTGTVFINKANDAFSKKWSAYQYYSGSTQVSSGNKKHIKNYVLLAAIIGLFVILFLIFKNSSKEMLSEVSSNVGLTSIQSSVESGQKYYENGDYDSAIKQFDEVIRNDPENAPGYAWRGNTYRRQGKFDMAIKDLNEAIRLDPKYSFAYSRRGEAYRGKGEYNTAIKDFNEAITLDPNDSWAYGSRGQAYKQLGQREQAIRDFEKALSLDPSTQWVRDELREIENMEDTEH
jgi:serine/threonine protein kinase/tetratricopeptide (TPR) repeat protein